MPQRDWQGRSLDDPEWDGDGSCLAVVGLMVCTAIIAVAVGIIIGRWLG